MSTEDDAHCNPIKKMSACEKIMSGCKTCIIFNDMHECLNLFRKRYIRKMKEDLQGMRDGQTKNNLSAKLSTYINQVCSDPTATDNDQHDLKYKSGWYAASALGCPSVTIDDRQYCHFACTLRECPDCCDNWEHLIPMLEIECADPISYIIFGVHSKCSYHGDCSMRVERKESICEQCENTPDEKRANLKGGIPKVKQVKLWIMFTEPLNEFLSPGGAYET